MERRWEYGIEADHAGLPGRYWEPQLEGEQAETVAETEIPEDMIPW